MLSKIKYQAKLELKHNFLSIILANIIILGIVYFIFGFKNLDINIQGIVVEKFLPLIGVFTFLTLFYAEEKSPIKDILTMRNTRLEFIYIVRILIRTSLYLATTLIYLFLIFSGRSSQEVLKIVFHSISIGVSIGVLGLLVFSLTNNISLAFLSLIGLILAQWFAPKKMGQILLFTMPKASVSRIVSILGVSLIILVLAMEIWKKRSLS